MARSTKVKFDVMKMVNGDERFVCTMEMDYNPLFPIPYEEWVDFVVSKRPSLAKCDIRIRL